MFGIHKTRAPRRSALVLAALCALAASAPAGTASAASLFEFLFGGRRAPAPPPVVAPLMRALGDPFRGGEREDERVERGPSAAYCVRLCDGHPFPVQNVGVSPAQACSAFCPASQTKVFAGSGIDYAVSSDGKRYADLPNAFLYRQKLVPGCTCNGKTAGGLVPMDAKTDPTLRPGDMVATRNGLVAFRGMRNQTAEFTPVQDRKLTRIPISPAAARAHAEAPPPQPAASGEQRRRVQR